MTIARPVRPAKKGEQTDRDRQQRHACKPPGDSNEFYTVRGIHRHIIPEQL